MVVHEAHREALAAEALKTKKPPLIRNRINGDLLPSRPLWLLIRLVVRHVPS
jgi:hypothetical protein